MDFNPLGRHAAPITGFAISVFRFCPGLALATILLGLEINAQAQSFTTVKPVTGASNIATTLDYGKDRSFTVTQSGSTPPGTLLDASYTITNATAYPMRFLLRNAAPGITLSSPNLVLQPGYTIPDDVTLQPNQSLTVSFQFGVPDTSIAVNNASATFSYGVSRVYDQVWNDDDFWYLCGWTDIPDVVLASNPQSGSGMGISGINPGCVYGQNATIHNDLSYPVTVSYAGYTGSGTIAPYLGGTLEGWADGITLQPGQSSDEFSMLVGMPWFIGNESRNTSGSFLFSWNVAAPPPVVKDDSATTQSGMPVTINVQSLAVASRTT